MNEYPREWMVRTRQREILGPFNQIELLEELQNKTFSLEDEIAPSTSYWISAQTLHQREMDEITRTSTRNQTVTSSIPSKQEHTLTPTPTMTPTADTTADQKTNPNIELTPTPSISGSHSASAPSQPNSFNPATAARSQFEPAAQTKDKSLLTTLVTIIVVGVVVMGFLTLGSKVKKSTSKDDSKFPQTLAKNSDSESPFLRQVNGLIESGDTQGALKQLTQYHEKHQGAEMDYVLPYAALLITEGESPSRAKKLLEQVIASQSSPTVKSHAHHWMGYLLLSQDDGDMGESHFLEALQLNPKDAAARFNLGRAYLKQEKFSQALDYLQLSELEMPNLWLIHIYKGWARVALGNMEEARSSFKTAIQSSKDRWMTYIYYAIFLMGLKEYDEAKITLTQMLAHDPHYEIHSPPPMGFFQGKVNYSEYLNAYNRVMEKGSNEEREMGKIYLSYLMNNSAGNTEWKRMQNVAEKGGGLWPKIVALKMMLDHETDPQELKTFLTHLPPTLDEFGPYAYVLRGQARERLSQVTDAQNDYQKALVMDPKSAVSHWAYANLLKKLHRREEAHQEINNLLSYHPNYIPAIVSSHNF